MLGLLTLAILSFHPVFVDLNELDVKIKKQLIRNPSKLQSQLDDTIDPMCSANDGIADVTHFLLSCHLYMHIRIELLNSVCRIKLLIKFLLYIYLFIYLLRQ